MSQDATFGQATHTLTVIDQQKPSTQDLKVLHDGYLADLLRAIKLGTVPLRADFQKLLGLLPELKIFKTLTLGLHKSPKDYRKALESAGFRIGDYANQILKKISVAKAKTEVDLVLVTVAELGFKDGARRAAIYARAIELGLELCPSEVGPVLRLATKDSPWILVGMEPIIDSDGDLRVFIVDADSGARWLHSHCGCPGHFWYGGNQWVFVRPRLPAGKAGK
jgi:hypothetical protein